MSAYSTGILRAAFRRRRGSIGTHHWSDGGVCCRSLEPMTRQRFAGAKAKLVTVFTTDILCVSTEVVFYCRNSALSSLIQGEPFIGAQV